MLTFCRIGAAGLGLVASLCFSNVGHTQALAPSSGGPAALPGLNNGQALMAQSINNVCPTISQSNIFGSSNQRDLANICTAMIVNSLQAENIPSSPSGPTFGLSANGVAGALSQLNGGTELVVPTSQAANVQNMQYNLQNGVIEERLSLLRHRLSGSAFASVEPQPNGQLAAAGGSDAVSDAQLAQNPTPSSVATWSGPLGIYLTGIGQFGTRDTTGSQNGYSFNNGGFVSGADYAFNRQFVAGMAFSYTHATTDFNTSATSAAGQFLAEDMFQGNLYATYAVTDALYFNGVATIGGGNNSAQRQVVIPSVSPTIATVDRTMTGNFGSSNYAASLGGGYNLPFGALVVTPTARFQYDYAKSNSFSENGGAGIDLSYGSSNHRDILSFIGGQVRYTLNTTWGPLTPMARFEWAHQYNSGNNSVSVAYSNDPLLLSSFAAPSDRASRDYFTLGAGLSLQLAASRSLYFTYDAIVGLNHTTFNSLTGGLRITF